MLSTLCCLGESVLLKTLDYFVKSSSKLSVDSLMSGSVIFSPREREQLNRFVNSSLPSCFMTFAVLSGSDLFMTYGAM